MSFAGGEDDAAVGPSPGYGLAPEENVPPGQGVRRVLPLSLLTALCFGAFFVVLDRGTASAGGATLWVALGVYAGALPTTVAASLFARRSGGLRLPAARRRPACWRPWRSWAYSPSSATSP